MYEVQKIKNESVETNESFEISSEDKKNNTSRELHIGEIIPWIVLVVVFALSICYVAKMGLTYLDSDQAGELMLAKLQNTEKSFLSPNWYYSTSFRIFEITPFMRLGFLFFANNWHAARVMGQIIVLACLAASYIFMGTAFGSRKASVYMSAVLMLPFGYWYFFHVIMFGFYAPYMMTLCIGTGLFIRMYKIMVSPGGITENKVPFIVMLVCSMLLAFINTLGSVRMLMNFYGPMVITAFCLLYMKLFKKNKKKTAGSKGEVEYISTKAFWNMPEIKYILICIITTIAGLMGYLVNIKILSEKYIYHDQSSQAWKLFNINNLLSAYSLFFEDLGYPVDSINENNVELFSLEGMLGAFSLIIIGLLFFSLIRLIKRYKTLNLLRKIVLMFFVSMMCVVGATFGLMEMESNGSYWLPAIPAVLAILQMEFETEEYCVKWGKVILPVVLGISVVFTSVTQLRLAPENTFRSEPEIKDAVEWLIDNGYTTGFAEFWYSDLACALSEGKLDMYTVYNKEQLKIYDWLQYRSHETRPDEPFFILVKVEQSPEHLLEDLPYGDVDGLEVAYDDGHFFVLTVAEPDSVYEAIASYFGEEED